MKKIFSKLNYPLLILTFVYAIFGLIMIYSASNVSAILRYDFSSYHFFVRQAIVVGGCFLLSFVILLRIPTNKYRFFSNLLMYFMIGLLIFLYVAGSVAGGALSWYELGFFNMQPTEFVKISLIIFLSVYYHRISFKPQSKKITVMEMLYPLIISAIVFILIAAQPDFGGAFIIFVIVAMIFFSLPFGKVSKKTIYRLGIGGVAILVIAILIFGKSFLQSYQMSRILNFTKPCERMNYADGDSGYQVCNGYMAIHNGGLLGVGLGNSTQKRLYLPEAHTDFIFPIICEELGLLVGIAVIFGYFVMLFLILNVAKEARTMRNSILAYGIFAYFMSHILINLLGVLGLIPLTGVPLPFLSYGGSYNTCVIISLFIVQRINIENREEAAKEKIARLQ